MAEALLGGRRWILVAETAGRLSGSLMALGDLIVCRSREELSRALCSVLAGELSVELLVLEEELLGMRRLEILEAMRYAGLPCPVVTIADPRPLTAHERRLGICRRLDAASNTASLISEIAHELARPAPPRSGVFRCVREVEGPPAQTG